jgi:peptidoglycan/LPS O-acetylase OafA/YrhL
MTTAIAPRAVRTRLTRVPTRTHAPGLDGLRGLALAAVVVYHSGPETWLPGGWLGVTLFFVLSGYLITSLTISETARTGWFSPVAFTARRLRRLVPALATTLIGVAVLSAVGVFRSGLGGGLLAGATWTSNLAAIARGEVYGAGGHPSPLTHLWSLAVEEQFYVVWPLVALWAVRGRSTRLRLGMAAGVAITAATVAGFLATSATSAYYSPIQRCGEIAVGVVAACLWPLGQIRPGRWVHGSAAAAGAVLAWWMATVPAPATVGLWTQGAMLVTAALSAVLVVAAAGHGGLGAWLSNRPLRWLGRSSYAIYLVHWPVVVALTGERTHLDPVPLFALRVIVTLAVAVLTMRLVERPLRRLRPTARPGAVVGVAVAALAAVALFTTAVAPRTPELPPAPAVTKVAATAPPAPADVAIPAGPPTVVWLGDSTAAWLIRDAGASVDPEEFRIVDGSLQACEGLPDLEVRSRTGAAAEQDPACTGWPTMYPAALDAGGGHAEAAIVMASTHAALDQRIDGTWVDPCSAIATQRYVGDYGARLELLASSADTVVAVLPPWPGSMVGWIIDPNDSERRMGCVRDAISVAARGIDQVQVLDLAELVCPGGPDDCDRYRGVDAMHYTPEEAPQVLAWILDRVDANKTAGS